MSKLIAASIRIDVDNALMVCSAENLSVIDHNKNIAYNDRK